MSNCSARIGYVPVGTVTKVSWRYIPFSEVRLRYDLNTRIQAYPKTDALWRLIPVQPLRYSGWALTNRLHEKTVVSRSMFLVNIYII